MQLCILIFICQLSVAVAQVTPVKVAPATEASIGGSVTSQLVGAWRLVSVETMKANGEVIYPFYGKHPEGLLVYDRSGWMSVQIASDPKPTVTATGSREGFLAATPAEKAMAADGYYAYFGTWTVNPSGSAVTHHIVNSFYPAERGDEAVRPLSIEGNRLTLTAKAHEMGEEHQRKLVWERVVSAAH